MKVPIWTDITEQELRSKNADELAIIFQNDKSPLWFEDFCHQEDVSFDLVKDVAIWGTFGPDENKHPLKWVKLKNCDTNHLIKIRDHRRIEDDFDGIMVSILYDRGAINTCDNCNHLRSKMKFDSRRYYCLASGSRGYPERYVCDHWEERTESHSFEGTCIDYGIDPKDIPLPKKLE